MSTVAVPRTPARRREAQGGPPLGVLAVIFTALFAGGLIASVIMAGGKAFPSPFTAGGSVAAYFRAQHDAVQVMAFTQLGTAIPLAIYAATVSARLHSLGIRAPGATIAQVGGVLAAAWLGVSAMASWALSQPGVTTSAPLVRALQDISFAAGGPGHVAGLGLLVAGIAVPGLLARLIPRWLAIAGLVIAVIAELGTLTLLIHGMALLLPAGRFAGYAWLIAAGFLLPRTRPVARAQGATAPGASGAASPQRPGATSPQASEATSPQTPGAAAHGPAGRR